MEEVLIFATLLAPFVTALVELVKQTTKIPKGVLSLVALALGIAVGFVAYPFTDMDIVLRLWAGGISGLAATGLFEGLKSLIRNKDE